MHKQTDRHTEKQVQNRKVTTRPAMHACGGMELYSTGTWHIGII